MDSTVLKTFISIVESGSLVAAAEKLNVTQSTVTARINSLEQQVGQKLLRRNKSGAELTPAGAKLLRYAETMLQLWRQAKFETSLPKGFVSVCNIGSEVDLWENIGESFLDYMAMHSPDVALAAWPGDQGQIERWLRTGLVDVAFCYSPISGDAFDSQILFEDQLILVTTVRDTNSFSWGTLRDNGYIHVEHGEEFRRGHADLLFGTETPAISLASAEWTLDHLFTHGGAAYLSTRHLASALAAGRLTAVPGAPSFTRRIFAVANVEITARWSWFEEAIAVLRTKVLDNRVALAKMSGIPEHTPAPRRD